MKPHIKTKVTKSVLWFALTMGAVWAMALSMPGCASLGGPDLEQKLIAAASKCISDASTILVAQREADATEHAAVQLLALQREANEKKCDAPAAAAAMPLQSRKP